MKLCISFHSEDVKSTVILKVDKLFEKPKFLEMRGSIEKENADPKFGKSAVTPTCL